MPQELTEEKVDVLRRRANSKRYAIRLRKERPWLIYFRYAWSRCTSPKSPIYYRYGGKGIKMLLTKEQIKEIWFRDKAFDMKNPSLDRIDNNGDYTIENSRFIPFGVNAGRTLRELTHCKHGHPFSGDNLYIVPKSGWRHCLICKQNRRPHRKPEGMA